jgi:hypothetical protein
VYATSGGYSSTVPVGSNLRKALDSAFQASTRPAQVVAGRAKGTAILSFAMPSAGIAYDFTIATSGTTSVTASITAVENDTAELIASSLKSDLDSVSGITDEVTATVVGTGNDAVLEISLNDSDFDFTLTNLSDSVVASGRVTESEADILASILDFNSDWTYVVSTDHTPSHQLAMAAACNVLKKPYMTSTSNELAYSSWDEVSIPDAEDIGAMFAYRQYDYAHCMYHHRAEDYPETLSVTEHTFLTPGRDSFQYKKLGDFGLAQISDLSRKLSESELYNLSIKNIGTIISLGGISVKGGFNGQGARMGSGVGIRTVAIKKYIEQELLRATQSLFYRFRTLNMNNSDLNLFKQKWATFLDRLVSAPGNSSALAPSRPYQITLPDESDISFETKVEGLLRDAKIVCYIDPSIDGVALELNFTFSDPALEAS